MMLLRRVRIAPLRPLLDRQRDLDQLAPLRWGEVLALVQRHSAQPVSDLLKDEEGLLVQSGHSTRNSPPSIFAALTIGCHR